MNRLSRLALLFVPFFLACNDPQPVEPDASAGNLEGADLTAHRGRHDVARQIAALRHLVAPLHRLPAAQAAGFDTQLSPCVASPEGGMGYHWGYVERIDGTVQWDEPEILVFVPSGHGPDGVKLGAVEYVVPKAAWAGSEPPSLYGQTYTTGGPNGELWALHVWVGKHNPLGLFYDWNPKVSCDD